MAAPDLVAIVRAYLDRALREAPGMKALLLDAETARVVATAMAHSELLEREVFLVERLDAPPACAAGGAAPLPHLAAVAFVRPTRANVARLRAELRAPRFGAYHLAFSNRLEDMRLQDLAEGDGGGRVASVREHYADFIALEAAHAVVPLPRPARARAPMAWDFGASAEALARLTEGVAALALSLRRRFVVRHQRGSEAATRLAQTLHHLTAVEQRELFDFGARPGEAPPLLLLLDRRDDPVTPLLSQWTYQAMAHEILGSRDNRAPLPRAPGAPTGAEDAAAAEAVLSPAQDAFFAATMHANFGDAGMAVKGLVDACAAEAARAPRDATSLADLAALVDALPELGARKALAAKHVAVMGALSRAVEVRQLMRVSGVEQEIACAAPAAAAHADAAAPLVRAPTLDARDRARLAALYALRYGEEDRVRTGALLAALAEGGAPASALAAVRALLRHCPASARVADAFGDRSVAARLATLAKQHLAGVENVYTRHAPPLRDLLERAARGRLTDADYPRVDAPRGEGGAPPPQAPPRLVLAFIVGGTTYAEARAVAELNAVEGGARFVLAGSGVQSGAGFLAEWGEVAEMEHVAAREGSGGLR
jgi:vacuolar protein sorting-associated protein 45